MKSGGNSKEVWGSDPPIGIFYTFYKIVFLVLVRQKET